MYFYCYIKLWLYICSVKQEQLITIKKNKIMATIMTKLVNMDGTYRYEFQDLENDVCSYVFKKKCKKEYKYALIFWALKEKGAGCDSSHWRPIALGNNAKNMVNSWKSLYPHGNLIVIEIR